MEKKKFELLLKTKNYKNIIRRYCNNEINLTNSQLTQVINLKNGGLKNEK